MWLFPTIIPGFSFFAPIILHHWSSSSSPLMLIWDEKRISNMWLFPNIIPWFLLSATIIPHRWSSSSSLWLLIQDEKRISDMWLFPNIIPWFPLSKPIFPHHRSCSSSILIVNLSDCVFHICDFLNMSFRDFCFPPFFIPQHRAYVVFFDR